MRPDAIPDPSKEPTISVEQAADLLGIGRGLAYESVKDGTIPSLRLGRLIRVPTARLLVMLGVDDGQLLASRDPRSPTLEMAEDDR